MSLVIMKFGGTSVGDAANMRRVGELVREALPQGPVVVLSAMSGVTNALLAASTAAEGGKLSEALEKVAEIKRKHLAAAAELFGGEAPAALDAELDKRVDELKLLVRGVTLLRELSPRSADAIASFGERLSTLVFTAHLEAQGVPVTRVDARTVMRTDDRFGRARPDEAAIRELAAALLVPHAGPGRAVVTQGYVGATEAGVTTTLGRGGSDYSAALLGAAIDASEVQIWTDVEGVFTGDPRLVPEAQHIERLSFAEAAELASFGAKVLHPATIQPAVRAGIPVSVRHTERPGGRFTTITAEVNSGRPVTALASRSGITVITVTSTRMLENSGFLERLFEVFGRHQIDVDLIATAEVSVSMTVPSDAPIKPLLAELGEFSSVTVAEGRAIVAVVGERLKHTAGLSAKVFGAIEGINVEMISMGANEINLSLVVEAAHVPAVIERLHKALFE
ncbi:MAG TPA: lysine-sensitive aspartokinase 3 [Acidobacteriota bacterium]